MECAVLIDTGGMAVLLHGHHGFLIDIAVIGRYVGMHPRSVRLTEGGLDLCVLLLLIAQADGGLVADEGAIDGIHHLLINHHLGSADLRAHVLRGRRAGL